MRGGLNDEHGLSETAIALRRMISRHPSGMTVREIESELGVGSPDPGVRSAITELKRRGMIHRRTSDSCNNTVYEAKRCPGPRSTGRTTRRASVASGA